ncbi:MAG TPA: hypothetical protein ENI34_10385 [candidate division WOR-3 bacterium]|uniref:Uncharacterized protein n=1 Tax=candidate division WOR-3 bacterium TaxID=2052148 RepID=A0A9C9K137_UNCW3|nr:hypothetical protein [candidate division WOR-3 bacterium]
MATILERIKREAEKLTPEELLKLVDEFIHRLLEKQTVKHNKFDVNRVYGLGKGLWHNKDVQDYVIRLREDRFK